METNRENPKIAGKNQEIRDEKGRFVKGVSGNPEGKPKGTTSFKTDWENFIKKVAKSNGMSEIEINEQLLAVGFKKAKEGDYNFYRDIHDRVYGKPQQSIDHTTKGEKIGNSIQFTTFEDDADSAKSE